MYKRDEEASVGRMEWVEASVRGDFWQKDRSKSERENVQDGSETCCDACFGDGGTNKKKMLTFQD